MIHHTARQKRIRFLLIFFMSALVLSGLTAIPLQWELRVMMPFVRLGTEWGIMVPALEQWIEKINQGVQNGYGQYPFLAYGTDWLAFGHIAIAIAFIGPLRDPVRNIWVVEFGMIACALIVPWTLIFGAIRDIPIFWQIIDMSFGILGIIPLWVVYRDILQIPDKL
jgi:hypothetical protein